MLPALGSRLLLVAAACGPSLGGAVVRAGWLAWQVLVQVGRRPVGRDIRLIRRRSGQLTGREILESDRCLLLLLADNYNRTTNDLTTEAQSAQRTHRDFLAERSDAVSGLVIIAGYRKQRRAAHRP
ncbi:MAG: hypothetical protein NTY37_08950 [Methanothrix sp.]|nr:hypothetical protein [Methanothrix sp.]